MFSLCRQSIYYLLLSVLAEVSAILIIGFNKWWNIFTNNYIYNIGGILIYLVIIQLLCMFDKNIMAWILFYITLTLNIISLLAAIGENIPEYIKKHKNTIVYKNTDHPKENSRKKSFDMNANESCKSSCHETCYNNRNKPIDFDCNSYCKSECNKNF